MELGQNGMRWSVSAKIGRRVNETKGVVRGGTRQKGRVRILADQ